MNKKTKILIGVLLAVVIIVVIALVVRNKTQKPESKIIDGTDFTASITGDEARLSLDSNITTGYTWVVSEVSQQISLAGENYVEDEHEEGMMGVGGTTELQFLALQEGIGTANLQYKQDWEGGSVDSTYQLQITVSKKGKNLQIDNVSMVKLETES